MLKGAAVIVRRLFPVEGKLAVQGMSAGLHRAVLGIVSLSIAVAMLVSVATMVGSFRETVIVWVNQTLRADLYLRPAAAGTNDFVSAFDATTVATVAALPQVRAVDRFRAREIIINGLPVTVGSGEFAVVGAHGHLLFMNGRTAADVAVRMVGQDRIIVSEPFTIKQGLGAGDFVQLPTPMGVVAFEIEAVFYDYSNDRGLLVMDRSTYLKHYQDESVTNLAVYLNPGVNVDAARSALAATLSGTQLRIASNIELREQVLRVFDRTFQVTYALEAVALIVAVLGIANVLAALVLERRPEFAMYALSERRRVRSVALLCWSRH